METILDIIKKYKDKLHPDNFRGDIYFADENGSLIIDRSILNKMLNKINVHFNKDSQLVEKENFWILAFKSEFFEDNSDKIFREDRNYYRITLLTYEGIISLWSEETIGSNKSPDEINVILWDGIQDLKMYTDSEGGHFLKFFFKDSTDELNLYPSRFGKPRTTEKFWEILYLLNDIIEYHSKKEQRDIDEYNNLYNLIAKFGNQDIIDNTDALKVLENFKDKYVDLNIDDSNTRFYYNNKIKFTKDTNQAIRIFEDYKKLVGDKLGPATTFDIAKVYENSQNYLSAVNFFSYSEENYTDSEIKNKIGISKANVYTKLISDFTTIDYSKRKLVFIADDILHTTMDGMVVLKKNELPEDIMFPLNHPKINEVYVCHPINKSSYLPIKEFEKELFTDRLHELMLLLGSLGAKKIDISSQERNRDTQNQSSNTQVNASLNVTITSVQGNHENNKKKESSLEHELNIKFHQTLNPKKTPFVPGGLVWYHSNLGWQRLTNQRLNGNLLTHTEVISTKQVETLSTNEINKLNAEVSLLLGRVKASGGYANEVDVKSLAEKDYTLEVNVEFEDIDNLQQVTYSESVLTIDNKTVVIDNYDKYADEVRFMLEDDGIIDEKERRILERLRSSLGLSVEEVMQIESEITALSQSENEYLEEYQAVLLDGEITDKERRLLNRLSSSLGISEDRAKAIEQLRK